MDKVWATAVESAPKYILDLKLKCVCVCLSHSFSQSGKLQLFDLASGGLMENVAAHEGALWSLALSPDQVCLSDYPSVCLSTYVSICLSLYLPGNLFVPRPGSPVSLFLSLSCSLSLFLCMSVLRSTSLCV